MANNQSSSPALIVQQLATLLRTNGHRILHGDTKVCFTSDSLILLNNYFQIAKLTDSNNTRTRINPMTTTTIVPVQQQLRVTTKLREDLVFLHDFLQKLKTTKIIHNSATLQRTVSLRPFENIVYLEVKKIPPQMIYGLTVLRTRLETLIFTQSVSKIETLISDGGLDSSQPNVWPCLKFLFLNHNFIENIDQSLKYLPVLEVLDLSHNRLRDCSNIFDFIPKIKHLNLSSNQLLNIPIWSTDKAQCQMITLKMRQNRLTKIIGIEKMKSIEELDLSENYITNVPQEIRALINLKKLFFSRNPFSYASGYRQMVIRYLPFVDPSIPREINIDNQPLTNKEKQMIPRLMDFSSTRTSVFRSGSPSPTSTGGTTTESATETESNLTSNSQGTIVVHRYQRSRRQPRDSRAARLRSLDRDEIPPEPNSSDSDFRHVSPLPDVIESSRESESIKNSTPFASTIIGPNERNLESSDDNGQWKPIPSPLPGRNVKRLPNDHSKSPNRRRSPKPKRNEAPVKIYLEVVDVPNEFSDDTPVPDSPESLKEQFEDSHGDSVRTTFFVTNLTANDSANSLLTVKLSQLFLIEENPDDNGNEEKIKYSIIELLPADGNQPKIVEFNVRRQRNSSERRIYAFDTIQDRTAFVDEMSRHLGLTTNVDAQHSISSSNSRDDERPVNSNSSFTSPIVSKFNSTSDETYLDNRLHFHVVTEYFTDDKETITFHFQCLAVRSTTSRQFLAQTIITNYGIYIFQKQASNEHVELEYLLVAGDLLTNVLMLDVGYQSQSFTIELQTGAFAFLLADAGKTQQIMKKLLEVLSPIVESGEGALRKISRISSDEYRQRLFEIIRKQCAIDEPNDEMIDFYSIMIRMDQTGNSQIIALLLLQHWILMIEDAYEPIGSRHVRLPASLASDSGQLKCDLMHLVKVTNFSNEQNLFLFDFVDESETVELQWRLESLSNQGKEQFLSKVRETYRKLMAVPLPETTMVF